MAANFPAIDGERLWQTLEASGEIGKFGANGLCRLALSAEDKQMRDLFVSWAEAAGCTVTVDAIGNIFARRPGTDDSLDPVVMGSHLDTQIRGGKYDGILGVLSGLEVIRTLNDRDIATRRPLEVAVWTNEEGGRFNPPMMGASVFASVYPLDDVYDAVDKEGITVRSALETSGYLGEASVGGRTFDAYFELHIEQGPILDGEAMDIGIVTGNYNAGGLKIEITGETSHIGPTPMAKRRNALVGAAYLIAAINDIGWTYEPEGAKTTVSYIEVEPNLFGIIPNVARITADFRHPKVARVEDMLADINAAMTEAAAKARVDMEITDSWRFGAVPFDEGCMNLLKQTAGDMGLDYREIDSQAGHDAYAIARILPVAMVFTPCRDGITHNINEEIDLARTVPGVNLFLNAVLRRANRE
jgi:beta-ureidopropionase / N-carbamoyl-L-amino-acid hydrolase